MTIFGLHDKARAVVDAMERDMVTTLATKQDMAALRTEFRQDLQALAQTVTQEMQLLRHEMEVLRLSMTVRLGSMLMIGFTLLFAALKLT